MRTPLPLLALAICLPTPARCVGSGGPAMTPLPGEKSDKVTAERVQKEQLYEAYNLLHSLAQV